MRLATGTHHAGHADPTLLWGEGGLSNVFLFFVKALLKPKLASTSATRTASKDEPNPESLALSNFPQGPVRK